MCMVAATGTTGRGRGTGGAVVEGEAGAAPGQGPAWWHPQCIGCSSCGDRIVSALCHCDLSFNVTCMKRQCVCPLAAAAAAAAAAAGGAAGGGSPLAPGAGAGAGAAAGDATEGVPQGCEVGGEEGGGGDVDDDDEGEEEEEEASGVTIVCRQCSEPVAADECLHAMGQTWHQEHFSCAACSKPLGDGSNYFTKNDRPVCPECYPKHFCPQCHACKQPILGVTCSAVNRSWHPEHFACSHDGCGRSLVNAVVYTHQGDILCDTHYFERLSHTCVECGELITSADCRGTHGYFWHVPHFRCCECDVVIAVKDKFYADVLPRGLPARPVKPPPPPADTPSPPPPPGRTPPPPPRPPGAGASPPPPPSPHGSETGHRPPPPRPRPNTANSPSHPTPSAAAPAATAPAPAPAPAAPAARPSPTPPSPPPPQLPDDIGRPSVDHARAVDIYCYQHFLRKFCRQCAACNEPIEGGNSITAIGKAFHADHFRCEECNRVLTVDEPLFVQDDKLYCEFDYTHTYAERCSACQEPIVEGDFRTAGASKWHSHCFKCGKCDRVFGVDENFVNKEGTPYCMEDYAVLFGAKCDACAQPITGKYRGIGDKKFHIECLKCETCGENFGEADQIFVNEEKLYCEADYVAQFVDVCPGCEEPIVSGEVITVLGRKYHVGHCVCVECKQPFGPGVSVYNRDDQPYCKDDFENLFCPKCPVCSKPVASGETVSALGKTWHLEHFQCTVCLKKLDPQQEFFNWEGLACCREDFVRMNLPRCGGCGEPIEGQYATVGDMKLHYPDCLKCSSCEELLTSYVLFNDKMYCAPCKAREEFLNDD